MTLLKFHKKEVAYFMQRLYAMKLTTTSGGNISKKTGKHILITASATDKAVITHQQVCVLNSDGVIISKSLKSSMESGMHLKIYQARPDVMAIIHAHPVLATGFTATRTKINTSLIAEARYVLGEPVIAPYALMGTEELAEIVAEKARESNIILMENHGAITLGKTLLEAFDRMEVLEAAAKMTIVTNFLGNYHELTEDQKKEIDRLAGSL